MKTMQIVAILVAGLFLGLAPTVKAELPPGSYDKARAGADEAVTIQVTSVKTVDAENGKNVTIEAKVLGVERSKSGLKKGDAISIGYFARDTSKPFAGPRPIAVLDKDGVYPAFLNQGEKPKILEPAAHGESFKMTPENRQ